MKQFIPTFRVSLIKEQGTDFNHEDVLSGPDQCVRFFGKFMRQKAQPDRECFVVLFLNSKNGVIGANLVSMGGIRSTVVSASEVLKAALLCNASAMVLCHNHPSGSMGPSDEDKVVTRRIMEAATLFDIYVQDHLIISADNGDYYSFLNEGLIAQINHDIKIGVS